MHWKRRVARRSSRPSPLRRHRPLGPPEPLEARQLLAADLLISEFAAANESLLLDEDGDASDFIEIYNPGPDDVSLAGWYLTDDADALTKWAFPDRVLPAMNSLLVFASGKDRSDPSGPLHTNFSLSADGEYLGLVHSVAGGAEVEMEFAPAYPAMPEDVTYGIVQTYQATTLLAPDGSLRYTDVPATGGENGWFQLNYDDQGWQAGAGGLGYQRAVPGFTVRDVKASGNVTSIADAKALLDGNGIANESTKITPVVNFMDQEGGGGTGNFSSDLEFPNNSGGNDDDFVIRATGTMIIPSTGTWTFGTNSDDGLQLRIDGQLVINDDALHGPEDRIGQTSLSAGSHELELVFFERGGGAEVELFAAAGAHSTFDSQFRLIGDVANGGLPVETPIGGLGTAAGFSPLIKTNVQSLMYGKSSDLYVRGAFQIDDPQAIDHLTLRVQYDDGFVAYLNGTQVASRNTPVFTPNDASAESDRPETDAQRVEAIDLGNFSHLLQAGKNVLAIHALNEAADSDEFLLRAELADAQVSLGDFAFFTTPTPGELNTTPTVDGFLLDEITFSQPHGFYDNPFQLAIAAKTAGTQIRYTLDGSEPTETNGLLYTKPISIDRPTVIRARAFKEGLEPSHVATATYLFLDQVIHQSPNGAPPSGFPTSTNINGQRLDYGMDPDIVNHPRWSDQMIDALLKVPSMSLVMDVDDLLDPQTGIYTHAGSRGAAWERPASLELINPDGSEGFQVNAGVRIRGGFSRSGGNPKHAFRFFFRNQYGPGKLEFPLFGNEGVDEFDGFDLRTTQNYSWAFGGDPTNTFLRDVFARDVQREMGQPYTRSHYYHLYINGQYWGLYQTQERSEADYAASYFGGDEEDYDVIKSTGNAGGYQNEATDGNMEAYQRLANYFYQPGGLGDANRDDFWRVQGMNPDGTRNPDYERLLDLDNLMDYIIGTYYQGDRDAPVSRFVPEQVNNYFAIFNRENPDGFKFFEHDSEHTLDKGAENLVAQITSSGRDFRYFNPLWMHEQLAQTNSEYRLMFADRAYKQMFHDGPLAPDNARKLLETRIAEFDLAMIAESARWGDAQSSTPRTYDDWQNAVNTVLQFVSDRNRVVVQQLREQGWYPSLDPPQFAVNGKPQHGGTVTPTGQVSLFAEGNVANTVLLPSRSVWKYLDTGTDPGSSWYSPSFNDTAWPSGRAELGYGDGDEATVVHFVGSSSNKNITTYFRKSFTLADVDSYQTFTLQLKRDDGAIVYLNGKEVVRTNMPAGTVTSSTRAASAVGGSDESTFFSFDVDPALVKDGTNVLAVEIHQSSPGSTDISFDLQLLGGRFMPPDGSIYYTTDGSDPRSSDGSPSERAIPYSTPFTIDQTTMVNARVLDGGVWSPLNQARFLTGLAVPTADNLRISEVHYHPHEPLTPFGDLEVDADEFEFVEVVNVGDEAVDLTGVQFVEVPVDGSPEGIRFTFAEQSLDPGERIVVVANRAAFQSRYGTGIRIANGNSGQGGGADGEFGGQLSNSGETITLVDAQGNVLQQFAYEDGGDWPGRADGSGSSLQRISLDGEITDPDNWRSSVEYGGSPGSGPKEPATTVVINEVLPHTDPPQSDSIELYNTTGSTIDLSGWWVSDTTDDILKYQFPAGTTLEGGGYLVIDEADFNPGQGTEPTDFRLSATGDEVWLIKASPVDGRPLEFVDRVEFDATFNGVTIGRLPNGTADDLLVPLAAPTLGGPNLAHRVSDVVISEVHYHPSDAQGGQFEFVEIFNQSGSPQDLTNWQLGEGVDFDFPAGTVLAPGQALVVVAFDPQDAATAAAFRTAYGIGSGVVLVGPWEAGDALANGGETVVLLQPDEPPAGETEIPHAVVDAVTFDDDSPWPASADGQGDSLHRSAPTDFGRQAETWSAAPPSPGTYSVDVALPGDVDGDGQVTIEDIDTLTAGIWAQSTSPSWDLNQDGTVDLDDRAHLIDEILQLRLGDADGDSDVDALDLTGIVMSWTGAQQPGAGSSGWADGDFDGDRDVDSGDLTDLITNWTGSQSATARAVDAVMAVSAPRTRRGSIFLP